MPYVGQRLKTYLDKGSVLSVPYSTRVRRSRRIADQRAGCVPAATTSERIAATTEPIEVATAECASPEGAAPDATEGASPTTDQLLGVGEPVGDHQEAIVFDKYTEPPVTHNTERAQIPPVPDDTEVDDYEDLLLTSDEECDSFVPQTGMVSQEEVSALSGCLHEFQCTTLPHSPTTVAEAIMMVMTFVVSHGLSWAALDDLLAVINALFGPASSVLPRTKYLFRKLWAATTAALTKSYFYCKFCGEELVFSDGKTTCACKNPECNTTHEKSTVKTDGNFFTILDLRSQILHVVKLNAAALHESLMGSRTKSEECITDITTAAHCRGLKRTGELKSQDLTITFNTDGSPVFKSSKSSIWPIQFTINELPPLLRVKNCVVAGLWFGPKHPNMPLFLSKFVKELEGLTITWTSHAQSLTSNVYATCCSVDTPARSAVQNYTSFNGYFGCPWCYASGSHDSLTMRYENTEPAEERTPGQVKRDMNLALECNCVVNGIKGPSPVMNMKNFNLVWSFPVEYMHAVLLGVTRQITEAWLDSSNCNGQYYIGSPSLLNAVDHLLLSIKPPHNFTRLPRSLKERSFWKASEWRLWLLFYSLPCTLNILPHFYWCHFRNLVQAIFILLSEELTPSLLKRADSYLQKFVGQVESYYGRHMMTYNVHLLLHLVKTVEHQGPLWANSAFVFESGNGKLSKCITAAKGVPHQVIERIVLEQEVEELLEAVSMSTTVKAICSKMVSPQHIQNAVQVGEVWLLGSPKMVCDLSPNELCMIAELSGVSNPAVVEYTRLTLGQRVFHSQQYKRPAKGDTTVICTHTKQFYVIRRILYVAHGAVCKSCLVCTNVTLTDTGVNFPSHIKECFVSPTNATTVIPLSAVAEIVLYIDFSFNHREYVCLLPNRFEAD